uniref:Uncharacterized protein n=1 Tax=Spongospora subterranea TaxID=70186 RepID=A0A0H5RDF6_9EUKA|eukprot:CRZ11617.1 hypothetical protein [Spongospora subterranea]
MRSTHAGFQKTAHKKPCVALKTCPPVPSSSEHAKLLLGSSIRRFAIHYAHKQYQEKLKKELRHRKAELKRDQDQAILQLTKKDFSHHLILLKQRSRLKKMV